MQQFVNDWRKLVNKRTIGSAMKRFLAALIHVLKDIHMTQEDTLAAIAAADAKVTKIAEEQRTLIGKVADLTAALAAAGNPSTPAIDAALVALNSHLQAVDDQVPDAAPPAAPAPSDPAPATTP